MPEFTEFEEEQIILLALESPDFFHRIVRFFKPSFFEKDVHEYIMTNYIEFYEKFDEVPSRDALKNIIYKELRSDDELTEPIVAILDKELDPKNAPYIKDNIIKWARHKQLSFLYEEEVMQKAHDGDYEVIDEIVQDAAAISDVVIRPFRFFNDVDELFIENERDYFTTGFSRLDDSFHNGNGPARREVFIWVAPTGVGKSIMLVNTAVANVKAGRKVLHVTLENSEEVTGDRYVGAFTNIAIGQKMKKEGDIKDRLNKIKVSSEGDLFVVYFPPETITVREVELAMKELYIHYGFEPDVLVVDYLECLLSKNQYKNRDEYGRQKAVATELRALAAVTNTVLFSASQTNRGGASRADDGNNINLDNLAESFGKAMPMDYVVSINQSQRDYQGDDSAESHIASVRFFIAKNRNGPKFKTVNARINYATMKAIEENTGDSP